MKKRKEIFDRRTIKINNVHHSSKKEWMKKYLEESTISTDTKFIKWTIENYSGDNIKLKAILKNEDLLKKCAIVGDMSYYKHKLWYSTIRIEDGEPYEAILSLRERYGDDGVFKNGEYLPQFVAQVGRYNIYHGSFESIKDYNDLITKMDDFYRNL